MTNTLSPALHTEIAHYYDALDIQFSQITGAQVRAFCGSAKIIERGEVSPQEIAVCPTCAKINRAFQAQRSAPRVTRNA